METIAWLVAALVLLHIATTAVHKLYHHSKLDRASSRIRAGSAHAVASCPCGWSKILHRDTVRRPGREAA